MELRGKGKRDTVIGSLGERVFETFPLYILPGGAPASQRTTISSSLPTNLFPLSPNDDERLTNDVQKVV